jgi:hypothetical protein
MPVVVVVLTKTHHRPLLVVAVGWLVVNRMEHRTQVEVVPVDSQILLQEDPEDPVLL